MPTDVHILYPTRTRLALLAEIDAGGVWQKLFPATDRKPAHRESHVDADYRKVTVMCDEMQAAGWIELGPLTGASAYAKRLWKLTDSGEAILKTRRKA